MGVKFIFIAKCIAVLCIQQPVVTGGCGVMVKLEWKK